MSYQLNAPTWDPCTDFRGTGKILQGSSILTQIMESRLVVVGSHKPMFWEPSAACFYGIAFATPAGKMGLFP